MPNTGLFHLTSGTGDIEGSQGRLTRLTSITATCLKCQHIVIASDAPQLVVVRGGAVINCENCGARQAVSNARFEDLLLRMKAAEERESE